MDHAVIPAPARFDAVARTFFTAEEIRRVIDLLEFYKLNVLHRGLGLSRPGAEGT